MRQAVENLKISRAGCSEVKSTVIRAGGRPVGHLQRVTEDLNAGLPRMKSRFYDNCRNSRAIIGEILRGSMCGQTHEFEIRATRQRARAGNSTICYRKKQIDVSSVIDNEFRHSIVKVVCGSTRLSPRGSTATLTML